MADYTVLDFAHALEAALGVPQSANNDQVLVAWQRAEGNPGWGQFNPYNIAAASIGQGKGGTARFASWEDGVQQTANFLRHDFYKGIVASLAADAPPAQTAHEIGVSPWAAGHYAFPQYQGGAPGGSIMSNLGANGNYTPGPSSAGGATPAGATDASGRASGSYSEYQFLVHDPQIGGYLAQLGTPGGIDDATFLNLLHQSDWWKNHSGSARAWQQLQASDPSSYNQQLNSYSRQIVEIAHQNGVGLDIPAILKLANQWGAESWTPQDATNAIADYAKPGGLSGGLAFDQEQVKQAAASYGIKLNDQQAYDYATGIVKNQQTLDGIGAGFAAQAAQMFPHLKPQLDEGFTLQQLATPYINTAASTLEIDPSMVDLSDPKWARALAHHDGKTVRQMTNYEWTQTLMSDPTYGFRGTQNGQGAAVGLATNMDKIFGVGVG